MLHWVGCRPWWVWWWSVAALGGRYAGFPLPKYPATRWQNQCRMLYNLQKVRGFKGDVSSCRDVDLSLRESKYQPYWNIFAEDTKSSLALVCVCFWANKQNRNFSITLNQVSHDNTHTQAHFGSARVEMRKDKILFFKHKKNIIIPSELPFLKTWAHSASLAVSGYSKQSYAVLLWWRSKRGEGEKKKMVWASRRVISCGNTGYCIQLLNNKPNHHLFH